MVRSITWREKGPFDAGDTLSLAAFCMSVPFLVPVFVFWQGITPDSVPGFGLMSSIVPFSSTLPLSAMVTALAFLFVCLLKTAHARIGHRVMISAFACYVAGYVLLNLWSLNVVGGTALGAVCGLLLGYGAAVLCFIWVQGASPKRFRSALALTWLCACCLFASAAVLPMLEVGVARAAVDVAAALSVVGCLRRCLRGGEGRLRVEETPVNWWDVFGHLDVSVVKEADDFNAPLARVLFFAVVPLAMLLLFVADEGLAWAEAQSLAAPLSLGGLLAGAAMVLLVRFKTDRALINFSYRFFLPLLAFATFVVGAFASPTSQHAVFVVGAFAFCLAYALVMIAMFATMAGRLRSLSLPAAGVMVLAGCLVCLLTNASAEYGVLGPYRYQVLLALLALIAVVLLVTPSARLWHVVLDGIDAAVPVALDAQESYLQRCAELTHTAGLTPREAEILLLLGRGHTSRFVAKKLMVAESTIRSHRKNIYRKLGVSSREELFKLTDSNQDPDA